MIKKYLLSLLLVSGAALVAMDKPKQKRARFLQAVKEGNLDLVKKSLESIDYGTLITGYEIATERVIEAYLASRIRIMLKIRTMDKPAKIDEEITKTIQRIKQKRAIFLQAVKEGNQANVEAALRQGIGSKTLQRGIKIAKNQDILQLLKRKEAERELADKIEVWTSWPEEIQQQPSLTHVITTTPYEFKFEEEDIKE